MSCIRKNKEDLKFSISQKVIDNLIAARKKSNVNYQEMEEAIKKRIIDRICTEKEQLKTEAAKVKQLKDSSSDDGFGTRSAYLGNHESYHLLRRLNWFPPKYVEGILKKYPGIKPSVSIELLYVYDECLPHGVDSKFELFERDDLLTKSLEQIKDIERIFDRISHSLECELSETVSRYKQKTEEQNEEVKQYVLNEVTMNNYTNLSSSLKIIADELKNTPTK